MFADTPPQDSPRLNKQQEAAMRTSDASMVPLVAVFSATVSAEELRAILLSSAAGADQHPARRRELADVAQHLHLTRDSLHTLPDMGYAEVVTTDAALADMLGFTDAEVIDMAARTKRVLVRAPGSRDCWQRAGVVSLGPHEPLLPPLLTDEDVSPSCTCPCAASSPTLTDKMPLVWQWARQVVSDADDDAFLPALLEPMTPSPSPVQATQEQQQQQQQGLGELADLQRGCSATITIDVAAAPPAAPAPRMRRRSRSSSDVRSAMLAAPEEQQAQAEKQAGPSVVRAASIPARALGSAAGTCAVALPGCPAARAAHPTATWQAVMRTALGRASTGAWRPRMGLERRQGCLAGLARAGVAAGGLEGAAPAAGGVKAAVGGFAPLAVAQAGLHTQSLPLVSH